MRRRGFHLVVAMLAVCLLASTYAFAQGGGASTTGSINGKVADSSGGVLPGVTVTATSPSAMGVADIGDRHGRQLPLSGAASRHLHRDLRAARLQHAEAREHRDLDGLHGDGERRARGGVTAGDRDGHRRFAGHRHVLDARAAELQAGSAAGNPERARPLVAARRHAWCRHGRASTSAATAPARRRATPRTASAARTACSSRASTRRKAPPAPASTSTTARFEEVFLGTIAQGAEMPTPGVQSQMLGKSGGNKFQGEYTRTTSPTA